MSETRTKNAVIESASISCGDRGFLDCQLSLDYGGTGQCFGGYVLYIPKSWQHHRIESVAGHFIFRVMEIAGVTEWENLPGRTIRVIATHSSIEAIGHITKDDWFSPKADFEKPRRLLEQLRDLNDQIGYLPEGVHPDERNPRAQTWLKERENWAREVSELRDALARKVRLAAKEAQ